MADITGTAGADKLYGTTGDDVINALEGTDVIHASAGSDQVDGGSLMDRLVVTIANATLFDAPTGSRTYLITSSSITDSSGSLNTSFTNVERLTIDLNGTAFGDVIDASGFVSSQVGGFYPLVIYAGDGDDTITGSAGADFINAGLGDNTLDAGGGDDEVGVEVDNSSGSVIYVASSGGVLHTVENGVATNSTVNAEKFFIRAFDTSTGLTIDASGVTGFTGTLAFGDTNATDVLIGSAGSDIFVNYSGNTLGNDVYTGNGGADTYDYIFAVDAMDGDTITDFDSDDVIDLQYNSADFGAPLIVDRFIGSARFSGTVGEYRYEIVGNRTLVEVDTNGDAVADQTLTLSNGAFRLVETASGSNILQIARQSVVTRAKLLLTEAGQDISIGGDVSIVGTTAGGEVIEIVRGNVTLDASFNAGGDTVVLPGNAGSYTAILTGSFVTISDGDISVAIPVGIAGLAVQFADSTRTLVIEGEQVVLGTQQISSIAQPVESSGAPLVDAVETGPDSFAKLILTAPGQDVDVGGNVSITGTTAPGEVVTVLGGDIRLDASFNAGGDTVVMPGASGDYTASLSGSFVTITDGQGTSVAIPVGVNGLTVDFTNASLTLRIEGGEVLLGDQVITASGGTVQSAAALGPVKDSDADMADLGVTFDDLAGGGDAMFAPAADAKLGLDFDMAIELHRFEFNDSFSFA